MVLLGVVPFGLGVVVVSRDAVLETGAFLAAALTPFATVFVASGREAAAAGVARVASGLEARVVDVLVLNAGRLELVTVRVGVVWLLLVVGGGGGAFDARAAAFAGGCLRDD